MMVAILATMTVALAAGQWGPRWLAAGALGLAFVLAAGLFLWQVHNPKDGYGMPWIQLRLEPAVAPGTMASRTVASRTVATGAAA